MSRLNSFLSGIRVLDLSRHLPGPLATLFLADMGAAVLKIEPPEGDHLRRMGPETESGRSAYFLAANAGKTTRTMDLKRREEHEAFCALARDADVLVESFRPGVMARLGLAYEDLKPLNPALIYCSLSGYGASGPLSAAPGHDINYMAGSGLLSDGARATGFRIPLADSTAGLFAATAVLGALHARASTGRGCHIDLAIADAVMPLQIFQLAALGATGSASDSGTDLLNGSAAYYRVYETADGRRVSLGAIEAKFWRAFCGAAERPEWISRQREPLPQRTLIEEVAVMFRGLTLAECDSRFAQADCCYAPVLDLKEAVSSPRVQARELVRRGPDGPLQALFPALVDGQHPAMRTPLREENNDGEPAPSRREDRR